MEWHSQDKFNSYNSWKCIYYEKWFRSIVEWYRNPEYKILSPIEASIDPSPGGACNLRCAWCNSFKYLGKTNKISDKNLIDLHKFLIDWGVLAFCEGGGGNPSLRKNLADIFWLIKRNNRQSSIADNGTMLNDKLIDAISSCCRWAGISVDAATSKTYKIGRGIDLFDIVIENIKKLVKKIDKIKSNCDVSYKFLVTPWNYKEIYDACKLAKELGVRDFHCRVADLSHQGMGKRQLKKYMYNKAEIVEQFNKCHNLRTSNFRTFTPTHKFDKNFKPYKNFKNCWAMPLLIQCCSDGNVYACVDQRLQPHFKLGSYIPKPENILNFWGKEKHWNLTFKEGRKNCNTRCTFTFYCEVCEKLFIEEDKDYMCRWFT
jgi:MoaA/NifB/PqqE/SkfB family radical SAM enzyme